jgi:hypothetical protein
MQLQIGDQVFRGKEDRVAWQADFDPLRLFALVQLGIDFGNRHDPGIIVSR